MERWRRNKKQQSECLHVSHGEQLQILMRHFSYYRSMSLKIKSKNLPFDTVNKLTLTADTAAWCLKMERAGKHQRQQHEGFAGDTGTAELCLHSQYLTHLESGNEKAFT